MKIPKTKTSLKRSRPRKARSHLPSLSQLTRDMLRLQMEADSRIPANVGAAIMQSFNAAANKGAESPDVVIETLDAPEKQIVKDAMQGYEQTLGNVGARGRMRLMMDSELDSLIEQEANDGN